MNDLINKTNWSPIKVHRNFYLLGLFGIAMGALEAIVVVYLRQIYYPMGFDFPLALISPQMISVEWFREIATIIMLISIGMIAGKNSLERFSYFLYTFAIWDLFYYILLKLLLNWPSSFFTWDILFLIPVPWIGPVLAPVICSLTMMLLSGIIINSQHRDTAFKIKLVEWSLIFSGALIILGTFMWDYSEIVIKEDSISRFWTQSNYKHFLTNISSYHPTHYNWDAFVLGEIIILSAIILMYGRVESKKSYLFS